MRKFFSLKLLTLLTAFLLTSFGFLLITTPKQQASAAAFKTYNYVISNSAANVGDISLCGKFADDTTYLISDEIASLDGVLEFISTDLAADQKSLENTPIYIHFDNFDMHSQTAMNLSFGTISFSGTIFNSLGCPLFQIAATASNSFIFENILINSAHSSVINILNSNLPTNIKLSNSTLNCSAQDSHAILFEDTNANIILENKNSHSSTYLFNYKKSQNISILNYQDSKIKISMPANLNDQMVLSNVTQAILASFEFVPENNSFSLEARTNWTEKKLFYSSKFDISLNHNDLNSTTSNDSFIHNSTYNLPTNLSNSAYHFGGWFGSCTIDSTTYYFDAEMLGTVANNNFDKQSIISTFKTKLGDLSNTQSFVTLFDASNTENMMLSNNLINLYYALNQKPAFIAKWEYEVSINLLDGLSATDIKTSIDCDAIIVEPSREGYSFGGWYFDENLTRPVESFENIRYNIDIFAKWNIESFAIQFYNDKNDANPISSQVLEFNSPITFPNVLKIGHLHIGWKTFDDQDFLGKKMPGKNMSVYAYFEKANYVTSFETDANYIMPITSKFEEAITMPETPSKFGYNFVKWLDKDTNMPFDFGTTPAKNRTAVAVWSPIEFKATFKLETPETELIGFEQPINYVPTKEGYKFLGWYDEDFLTKYETMPAKDTELFPKWQKKTIISLNLTNQSMQIDHPSIVYKIDSPISNFVIEYYIDGTWTQESPSKTGKYDVKITRAEDDSFAAYSEILPNGFEVLPKLVSLDIVNAILIVLFFLEIISIIAIRFLMKQRKNAPVFYSIIFPFAMFETTPFIIFAVMLLFNLIALIIIINQLIKLNNIVPEKEAENRYDNRLIISKIEDNSNDLEIEQKVDDLLSQNNLVDKSKKRDKIKQNDFDDYLK